MAMKSKANGDHGESIVAELFKERGYWAHVIQRNRSGQQPFDIVAVKNDMAWLVDAKYVAKGRRFNFSDVQPDQIESMGYAMDFANLTNVGFVIVFAEHDAIRFLSFEVYTKMKEDGAVSATIEETVDFRRLR